MGRWQGRTSGAADGNSRGGAPVAGAAPNPHAHITHMPTAPPVADHLLLTSCWCCRRRSLIRCARKRSLHWARLVGLGLMLAGVVLVTYFDGSTAAPAPAPAPPPLPGQPPGQPLTASGPVASGRALAEVASPLYGRYCCGQIASGCSERGVRARDTRAHIFAAPMSCGRVVGLHVYLCCRRCDGGPGDLQQGVGVGRRGHGLGDRCAGRATQWRRREQGQEWEWQQRGLPRDEG